MWRFQSTLPVWGATHRGTGLERLHRFQSTLPVWGATVYRGGLRHKPDISIHAPRVGSDSFWPAYSQNFFYFNPRSPCGERRASIKKLTERRIFQSTLPVWGATTGYSFKSRWVSISIHAPRVGSDGSLLPHTQHSPNFNPRSPCGERHYGRVSAYDGEIFQSTLPVWGATCLEGAGVVYGDAFQSTLPVWGATSTVIHKRNNSVNISIHAPRVGSDSIVLPVHGVKTISIHAPRVGSDHGLQYLSSTLFSFQSTLPVWGATQVSGGAQWDGKNFNPRSPCGERHTPHRLSRCGNPFQSTLPVWGATWALGIPTMPGGYFNPRSPCGERLGLSRYT